VRDRFIGVWKLICCQRRSKDGSIEFPYGEKPVGRIAYDNAGRMSAILMRQGRISTLVPGFTAYFGTFDVDEATTTVIHHVQASLVPDWVGRDLRRTYRFHENRLTLTALTENAAAELLWEREPD
jgi:hypothetical protein